MDFFIYKMRWLFLFFQSKSYVLREAYFCYLQGFGGTAF